MKETGAGGRGGTRIEKLLFLQFPSLFRGDGWIDLCTWSWQSAWHCPSPRWMMLCEERLGRRAFRPQDELILPPERNFR